MRLLGSDRWFLIVREEKYEVKIHLYKRFSRWFFCILPVK